MKYSGHFLTATGIIHSIIGLLMGWPILLEMHDAHWFSSTMVNGEVLFDREAITWFLLAGIFWILFGITLQQAIAQGFVPSASLGWGFLIIGSGLVIIMPLSGAYLFIIQGAILIIGQRKAANEISRSELA